MREILSSFINKSKEVRREEMQHMVSVPGLSSLCCGFHLLHVFGLKVDGWDIWDVKGTPNTDGAWSTAHTLSTKQSHGSFTSDSRLTQASVMYLFLYMTHVLPILATEWAVWRTDIYPSVNIHRKDWLLTMLIVLVVFV